MFLNTLLAALVNFSSIFIYSFEHIDGPLNEDRDIYFAPCVCCFFFLHFCPHPGFDNLFFVAEDLFFGDGFLLLFIIFVADLD